MAQNSLLDFLVANSSKSVGTGGVDSTKLHLIAKQAAADYLDNGTDINAAVANRLRDVEVTPEHVKRVCEFTNNETYNKIFNSQTKLASGELVYPTFDKADFSTVYYNLKSLPESIVVDKPSDYEYPPDFITDREKIAANEIIQKLIMGPKQSSNLDKALQSMMQRSDKLDVNALSKSQIDDLHNAIPATTQEAKNAQQEQAEKAEEQALKTAAFTTYQRQSGLMKHAESRLNSLMSAFRDVTNEFEQVVQRELDAGSTFSEIVYVCNADQPVENEKIAHTILSAVGKQLEEKHIIKTAEFNPNQIKHMIPNPESDVVVTFNAAINLWDEAQKLACYKTELGKKLCAIKKINANIARKARANARANTK